MKIEIPEWIIDDIINNQDWLLPDDAWTKDNKIDKASQAFSDFVVKEIEESYRNKDLTVAMENFLFEWKNNLRPRPSFEIIFKDAYNG